jgi:hypothetical protein
VFLIVILGSKLYPFDLVILKIDRLLIVRGYGCKSIAMIEATNLL